MIDLRIGDCLAVMPTLPENGIDTIITDPPYGLDFMGKEWDHGVPGIEFWQAALRVAKPGAILMAFGGTRTYHRLACAIEDAGWEIRDCMMWIYAQGFPKSLNFGCRCKEGDHGKQTSEHDMRSVRKADISSAINAGKESREVLLSRLPEQGLQERRSERPDSRTCDGKQPRMEGRSDVLQDAWKLQDGQVCQMSEGLSANGSQGRLCDGASFDNGDVSRSLPETDRGCTSSESQPTGQSNRESGTIPEQPSAQDRRGTICPKCGGIIGFCGYGTALKPAWEPIIVAMKPLDGTYAENAQKWGVAGLNIDGGRIVCDSVTTHGGCRASTENYRLTQEIGTTHQGRFPANLLLDEESAELLDKKSGMTKSSGVINRWKDGAKPFGGGAGHEYESIPGVADFGGASRFFYCAKASSGERNAGLEDRNQHPTVKPVDLMRYLCKLTKTPTGGVVLDPFMGSGTTGVACVLEHRDFIGIELQAEYAEIARKRIADMSGPLFAEAV